MQFFPRRLILGALAAATLASCGGGGSGGGTPVAEAPAPVPASLQPRNTLTPIQGPECITDTSGRFVTMLRQGEPDTPTPPPRKWHLAVRFVHPIDTPITSNFGTQGGTPVTNFDPAPGGTPQDYAKWQRGRVDGNASVTSGFQLRCDDVGSYIDTRTIARQALVANGPQAVYFHDFRDPADPATMSKLPAIYAADGSVDFVLQAKVEVPTFFRSGPADNPAAGALASSQVSMIPYVVDTVTGKLFAYVLNLYNSHPSPGVSVMHDEEVPFVSSSWSTNEMITVPPESSTYGTGTWLGLRQYRVAIPPAKFSLAISRLVALCQDPAYKAKANCQPDRNGVIFSANPADYRLVGFGMLHEVFTGPDNQLASGIHYRDVGAYQAR